MKVKTSYVPVGCDYLTVDKVYEVLSGRSDYGYIESDDGDEIFINFHGSVHIGHKPWEIVE